MEETKQSDRKSMVMEGMYRGVTGKIDEVRQSVSKELQFTSAQQVSAYEALAGTFKDGLATLLAEFRYLSQQNSAIYDYNCKERETARDALLEAVRASAEQNAKTFSEQIEKSAKETEERFTEKLEALREELLENFRAVLAEKPEEEQSEEAAAAPAEEPAEDTFDYDVLAEKIASVLPEPDYDMLADKVVAALPPVDADAIADKVAESIPLVDYELIAERVSNVLEGEFDVTVDENGVVRAVGAGTANITAALGSRTDSVAVTVAAAAKQLAYDFEDGTVGAAYAPELFAANVAGSGHNITVADVEGNKVLAYDFDGAADGFPNIIIKNEVVRALYETVGSMSFTLTNKGAKFHEGYYEIPSGTHRYDLFSGDSVTIVVPEEHMKELVDSGKDLVYIVNNDGTSPSYENARFTYYLDNVGAPSIDTVVEKGGTLSAADLLGKNATLKSFAVYKDNALVSEEGAESYTFAESGVYSVEYVQSFAGYEDVAIKGTVRVLDVVFDSVEEFYGADKLITGINGYAEPVVTEYFGVTMLRMGSNGNWPRIELNKTIVESFIAEGKTFTLVFRLGDIDGEHKTYIGSSAPHVSLVSGREFAEISITPEKWAEIKDHADLATYVPVVTLANVEGIVGDGSDPVSTYYAGYILS